MGSCWRILFDHSSSISATVEGVVEVQVHTFMPEGDVVENKRQNDGMEDSYGNELPFMELGQNIESLQSESR